ncbi:hypothetical protein DRQ11_03875 [candidate division KSB1 bacterium]|nr:MAG: hypothetical protein DRQ11_03875 [candidate division KSB1 bacterium]
MELLPVLWAQFRYLFLWEGSPEPNFIGVWRRLLQSGGMEHGFCEITFFSRIWARDRKIFTGIFRIWNDKSRKGSLSWVKR